METGRTRTSGERTRAEAAAWLARLQSDVREPADEAGFRAWLDQGQGRREAFDQVTSAWELAGGLAAEFPDPLLIPPRSRGWLKVLAGAAIGVAVTLLAVFASELLSDPRQTYATGPSDGLRIALADGSQVTLGPESRLSISSEGPQQSVFLERGQARFDVTRDRRQPLVVRVGSREVRSIGTVFDLQHQNSQTSVRLIDGFASINRVGAPAHLSPRILFPGERMDFDAHRLIGGQAAPDERRDADVRKPPR